MVRKIYKIPNWFIKIKNKMVALCKPKPVSEVVSEYKADVNLSNITNDFKLKEQTIITIHVTKEDMESLIRIREYFYKNNVSVLEKLAGDILTRFIKEL